MSYWAITSLGELEAMKGKIKKREIVIPCRVTMYIGKRYTWLALIGEKFGGNAQAL